MANTYSEFQNQVNSEKETLVVLEASKRLVGWAVHDGSVYVISSFNHVLSDTAAIQEAGTTLTAVNSVENIAAGKYFHDRTNKKLYLQTSASANPNTVFISCTFQLFFSKFGVAAAHDLATGFEVFWEPMVKDTSDFGVEVDNENQIGQAIEGSGSVDLLNNQTFWKPIFEKYYFANQRAFVYSWSPSLPASEAKLIFRGTIQGASYSPSSVKFTLKDQLFALRAPIALTKISSIVGARVPSKIGEAYRRIIYGEPKGVRPTNIDQIIPDVGYPRTGTVFITSGNTTLTGSGTSFLTDLSPDDQVLIDGLDDPVTIEYPTSATSAKLSEAPSVTLGGKTYAVIPAHPKRYANRVWSVAGHALRAPITTVVENSENKPNLFEVDDITDIERGVEILVGTEIATVRRLVPTNMVRLETNLTGTPVAGTVVKRFPITNVRINDKILTYSRDYTYDAEAGTLSLNVLAEFNIAPARVINGTSVTFTSGSRTVTGVGTTFTSQLTPYSWVKLRTQSTYYEVLRVISDTELELRAAAGYTGTNGGHYKKPAVYDSEDVLSCDLLGATEDGTTSGAFIKTGPQIVKDLMTKAGVGGDIDTASFTNANQIADYKVGLVIPSAFADTKAPKYRDVINQVNQSVFGSVVQTPDFKYQYHVLRPGRKASSALRFSESDVLKWSVKVQLEKIVKTVKLLYLHKEYDYTSREGSNQRAEYVNKNAQYLARATKDFEQATILVDATQAAVMARRWAFLFSYALTTIAIKTKMQGARLKVSDVVDLEHEKLYERVGGASGRRVGAISKAEKSGSDTAIEIDTLANAFTRCAVFTENTQSDWAASSENMRIFAGFFTDAGGMITNDESEYGINLFW